MDVWKGEIIKFDLQKLCEMKSIMVLRYLWFLVNVQNYRDFLGSLQ